MTYNYCPNCGIKFRKVTNLRDKHCFWRWTNEQGEPEGQCSNCHHVFPVDPHVSDPDLKPTLKPDRIEKLREKYRDNPEIPYVKATGGLYPEIGYVLTAVDDIIELLDMVEAKDDPRVAKRYKPTQNGLIPFRLIGGERWVLLEEVEKLLEAKETFQDKCNRLGRGSGIDREYPVGWEINDRDEAEARSTPGKYDYLEIIGKLIKEVERLKREADFWEDKYADDIGKEKR